MKRGGGGGRGGGRGVGGGRGGLRGGGRGSRMLHLCFVIFLCKACFLKITCYLLDCLDILLGFTVVYKHSRLVILRRVVSYHIGLFRLIDFATDFFELILIKIERYNSGRVG